MLFFDLTEKQFYQTHGYMVTWLQLQMAAVTLVDLRLILLCLPQINLCCSASCLPSHLSIHLSVIHVWYQRSKLQFRIFRKWNKCWLFSVSYLNVQILPLFSWCSLFLLMFPDSLFSLFIFISSSVSVSLFSAGVCANLRCLCNTCTCHWGLCSCSWRRGCHYVRPSRQRWSWWVTESLSVCASVCVSELCTVSVQCSYLQLNSLFDWNQRLIVLKPTKTSGTFYSLTFMILTKIYI